MVDACARVELSGGAVLGEPLLAAHRARGGPALAEVLERRAPLLRRLVGHFGHLVLLSLRARLALMMPYRRTASLPARRERERSTSPAQRVPPQDRRQVEEGLDARRRRAHGRSRGRRAWPCRDS